MRIVQILPPIPLELADGSPALRGNEQVIVTQREFVLKLLTEPGFVGGLRGIKAARALKVSRTEIESAFGPNGTGELSDDIWSKLVSLLDTVDFLVGPKLSVIACLLPFMDALVDATSVVSVENAKLATKLTATTGVLVARQAT